MQHGIGIELAERALRCGCSRSTHSSVNVVKSAPARVPVEPIAADAGPRRAGVLIAVGRRRHRDVVQRRKLAPDPRTGVVLIGDRVDAQLRDEAPRASRGVRVARDLQAAPARACWRRPRRAPRAAAGRLDRRPGRSARRPATSCRRRPRPCRTTAGRRRRARAAPAASGSPGVLQQVRLHLLVRVDARAGSRRAAPCCASTSTSSATSPSTSNSFE